MTTKKGDRTGPPKADDSQRPGQHAPQNDRLTQQTRKQLGKHYASKYRAGGGRGR